MGKRQSLSPFVADEGAKNWFHDFSHGFESTYVYKFCTGLNSCVILLAQFKIFKDSLF